MMHYTLCLITPAEALATANEMWRPLATSVPQDFPTWLEEYAAALDKLARSKL